MSGDIEKLTRASAPFWPKKQRKRFPTFAGIEDDRSYNVAIVGGGWVGLFAAYFLAKAGKSVILLDKGLVGGEASGHSGGLILDKFEGDIRELMKHCGEGNTQRILRASHDAMMVIDEVAKAERFSSGYKNLGHIVGFRNEREEKKYLRSHKQVHELVSDLYPTDVELLTAEQTGAPNFFKTGAGYSPKGGIFNPHLVIKGLLKALNKYGVRIYEESEVTAFEPAHRGVRMFVGPALLEAHQVILAGGDTSRLIEGYDQFPSLQPIIAGMLATEPLPTELVGRLKSSKDVETPVMCTGLGAPYYRFTKDDRLLFGSGGRSGKNEFPEIRKDIARDLFRVFPALKGNVDPSACPMWGRMLYHDASDLPFVYALDVERHLLKDLPQAKDISAARFLGVAGLGGQGNNFGPYLGRAVAGALSGSAGHYDILRLFHAVAPKKPLATWAVKERLAFERRMS